MHPRTEQDAPEGLVSGQIGRYEILRKIATGGMADLFIAKQVGLDGFEKVVAIKQILPHLALDDEFIAMFRDEARLVAKLNHPNIVQIYDLGRSDDAEFIVMEYIPGRNLSSVAKKARGAGQPMPPVYVARCMAQACEALEYAHTRRDVEGRPLEIIHRDVSPQNIIVGFSGSVKLVDFGIAKAASKVAHTRAGVLKGKYAYMSPEQIRGETIDARSDLFSVGVVLYELLCGRRPFEKESSIETLKAIVQEPHRPVRELAPEVPPALAGIIDRCLSKDKTARFQSAQAIQIALEDFVSESGQRCNNITISQWLAGLFEDELRRESGGTVVFQGVGEVVLPDRGEPVVASVATDAPRGELIEETPIRSRRPSEPSREGADAKTVFATDPAPSEAERERQALASALGGRLDNHDGGSDEVGDATIAMPSIAPEDTDDAEPWPDPLDVAFERSDSSSDLATMARIAFDDDPSDPFGELSQVPNADATLAMVDDEPPGHDATIAADATLAMDALGDRTLGAEEFEALMAARAEIDEPDSEAFPADATIAVADEEALADATIASEGLPLDDEEDEDDLDSVPGMAQLHELGTVRAMDEEPSLPKPAVVGDDRNERTTAGMSEDYWEAEVSIPEGGAFDPLPEPDLDFLEQVAAPVRMPSARASAPLGQIALAQKAAPAEEEDELDIGLESMPVEPPPAPEPAAPPPSRSARDEYASLVSPARPDPGARPNTFVSGSHATRLRAIPRSGTSVGAGSQGGGQDAYGRPVSRVVPAYAESAPRVSRSSYAGVPRPQSAAPRRGSPLRSIGMFVAGALGAAVLALATYAALQHLYPSGPTLTVESRPAGAQVWVDGALQAQVTPITIGGLDPGFEHEVQVVSEGFETVVRKISLGSGRPVVLEVELARLAAP